MLMSSCLVDLVALPIYLTVPAQVTPSSSMGVPTLVSSAVPQNEALSTDLVPTPVTPSLNMGVPLLMQGLEYPTQEEARHNVDMRSEVTVTVHDNHDRGTVYAPEDLHHHLNSSHRCSDYSFEERMGLLNDFLISIAKKFGVSTPEHLFRLCVANKFYPNLKGFTASATDESNILEFHKWYSILHFLNLQL